MVDIVPFKGLLFNLDKVGSMSQVVAPPYDVITSSQQEAFYDKSPHNIVRLILGKEVSGDNEKDNRYMRSAKTYHDWVENGILIQDDRPGFYVYSQDYIFYGNNVRRLGFIARVRLEDFSKGNICPHEFTLAKAKQDRSQLLQACHANFSPIFGLFSDPSGAVDRKLEETIQQPPLGTIEEGGIVHKLWRLQDEPAISFLTKAFADKKIYIADGHHRYETALAFHKEHGARVKDSAHVMIFLTNLESPSLAIHPIHRQVRCAYVFKREEFLLRLCAFFRVEPLPNDTTPDKIRFMLEEEGKKGIVFAVYLREGPNHLLLLKLEDTRHILPYLDPDDPQELQVLDVAQLHTLVIKLILKIDTQNPIHQYNLAYTIHIEEGINNVKAGKFDLAFFMNPTRIEQVKSLAEKTIRLPQKSTYFYPKLLSGLVINRFEP
jgi:uncharacterized protein (DUF1015 family)